MTLAASSALPVSCCLRRQLSFQVNQKTPEQTRHSLDFPRELGVGLGRDQVSLPSDRQLSFESKQLAFGGSVELALLRSGVPSIAVGDRAGRGEGGEHELISDNLSFASCPLSRRPDHLPSEDDCFLPDLEIPDARCHAEQDGHEVAASGTD